LDRDQRVVEIGTVLTADGPGHWSAMHIAAPASTIARFRFGPAVFPVPVSRSLRKSSARREQKSPYRERISKEFMKSIDDDRARALASALLKIAVIPRGYSTL
jgi:hypothetical protein